VGPVDPRHQGLHLRRRHAGDARKAVRTRGDIVLSNPDMLHQAILPHHTKWAQFFESLEFVVVDELHGYRGVFGSHVANVFRRLLRICRSMGPARASSSRPPPSPTRRAGRRLIGAPVSAVTDSGAPRGERHLLLWNPPVIDPDLGIRASARSQTRASPAPPPGGGSRTSSSPARG
jgi:DEAD/DEAH box helicase domain-containing protein